MKTSEMRCWLEMLTSYWELRTTSDELQEVSAFFWRVLAHGGEQVADALTVQVVAVISLDRVHEG